MKYEKQRLTPPLGIMYSLWLSFRSIQIGMETCIQATNRCTWVENTKGKERAEESSGRRIGDGMTVWQEKEGMKKR